jgi:hypothetical protein
MTLSSPYPIKSNNVNIYFRYIMEGGTQISNVRLMRRREYPLKTFTVVVDYPPQVHALTWRLKKRCTRETPLRLPHFYPHPYVEELTEDLIGRPLGFLGGQTYGLRPKPWSQGWTPRIAVYSDDATALYFKLDSGGFSSTFRSTIKLANPRRMIFRGRYKFQFRGGIPEKTQIQMSSASC